MSRYRRPPRAAYLPILRRCSLVLRWDPMVMTREMRMLPAKKMRTTSSKPVWLSRWKQPAHRQALTLVPTLRAILLNLIVLQLVGRVVLLNVRLLLIWNRTWNRLSRSMQRLNLPAREEEHLLTPKLKFAKLGASSPSSKHTLELRFTPTACTPPDAQASRSCRLNCSRLSQLERKATSKSST